jgi:ParB-like chromosome segregation protein Spo0J
MPIDDLVPWGKNPRTRNDATIAALADEIHELGFGAPFVAQAGTSLLIAGHGRRLALLKLWADDPAWVVEGAPGPRVVPVRCLEVDDATATKLAIADNRQSERSAWDEKGLAELLAEMDPGDAALVGFDEREVAKLLEALDVSAPAPDAFAGMPADDGFVAFKFGNYAGRVSRQVYNAFVSAYQAQQAAGTEPDLDGVMRRWLRVGTP